MQYLKFISHYWIIVNEVQFSLYVLQHQIIQLILSRYMYKILDFYS